METSGGEPDVVGHEKKTGEYIFYDCSAQSPNGRRSTCYDHAALESRKEHKPKHSATGMAAAMGIELLTEEQYRQLQQLGEFDTTASSWVKTPSHVRRLGGALFCDRRYAKIFLYHNGAESSYAARGARRDRRADRRKWTSRTSRTDPPSAPRDPPRCSLTCADRLSRRFSRLRAWARVAHRTWKARPPQGATLP